MSKILNSKNKNSLRVPMRRKSGKGLKITLLRVFRSNLLREVIKEEETKRNERIGDLVAGLETS